MAQFKVSKAPKLIDQIDQKAFGFKLQLYLINDLDLRNTYPARMCGHGHFIFESHQGLKRSPQSRTQKSNKAGYLVYI